MRTASSSRNGEVVALAPKTFDLLALLVENRGTVLDKETLFRKVWPDVFVEESSLTKNISLLRKCLGDGPDGRAYIEALPRRGYRFQARLAEVGVRAVEDKTPEQEPTAEVTNGSDTPVTGSRERSGSGALSLFWPALSYYPPGS